MNLAELKEAYKARKLALDSAKKEEEKYKALLKDAMLEAGESDYTDEAGYRFERIVQERKSMDEEKLLAELHERNLTGCIKTVEAVDEDATLKAVEAGELPQEVLADALKVTEVVMLKLTAPKKAKAKKVITIWKTPIVATVEQVLKDLKLQLYGAGLLKEIKNTGSDLMCTCPFHANGKEHNPSCGVLLQQKVTKDKTYEAGTVHCYTCGYTADLPQFVADLLGLSSPVEGFKWLVNQYNYQTEERELPDLDMYRGSTAKSSVLEESLVKQYTQNLLQSEEACRYLHKRRIANWVLEAYELGFDPEDKTVLFPVRGMDGKVIFYKGRSIAGKHFYNAKEIDKTSVVFGLWEILNGSFSWGTSDQIEEVWITESEIDALSLISYGVPAVAIMGSHISEDQCKELERTPFRRFVLATDNDDAGRKGASQIKMLLIPKGFRFINLKWHTSLKDINDLVKEYGDGWKDHLTGY